MAFKPNNPCFIYQPVFGCYATHSMHMSKYAYFKFLAQKHDKGKKKPENWDKNEQKNDIQPCFIMNN